ncbi:M48 family metalloprotease [Catellatospora vulcania]|uniref:M48 family metalloprotease n=1 Tax=Catellatospora vulcania TaxID=1460450 RepID=UPI0012D46A51|nr:M48 family metalloprotease [Catellatospora vulcania]
MAVAPPPRSALAVVSGTTLRFVSLVAAIFGTATYAFSLVYTRLPGNAEAGLFTYARCNELLRRGELGLSLDPAAIEDSERDLAQASRCLAPYEQAEAAWILAGLVLLLAVALALYLAAPWWTRRRAGLVPVTAADFPRLHAALCDLTTEIGLRRPPRFVLDPHAVAPGGLAFGRTGRYWVRINAGLVPLRITDPAAFRAVVLHELAHLRNRDVDIAYATMALWRAFVALALLPMAVAIVHPRIFVDPSTPPWVSADYPREVLNSGSRTVLFVGIVYLVRNSVLRAREILADARAAQHGAADGLRRVMAATAARETRLSWRRRFGVHPAAAARLHAIDHPLTTLRPGFGELFGAGVTTMLATGSLTFVAGLGLPHDGTPSGRYLAWLVAPVVVGVLAVAAWRAELLSAHGPRVPVLPAALGFSLGCLLGDLASILNTVGAWGVFGSSATGGRIALAGSVEVGGVSLTAGLVGAASFTVGILLLAAASAAGARAWLPVLRGADSRWVWPAGIAATVTPFAVWFGIWLETRSAPYLIGRFYHLVAADFVTLGERLWEGPGFGLFSTVYPPLQLFAARPLVVPAFALACLYPFTALLRRPRAAPADRPADAGDDPVGSRPAGVPDLPGTRGLRSAVLAGLAGAGVFVLLTLALRAVLHQVAYDTPGLVSYHSYAQLALAVAVQAVLGGVLAARCRRGLLLGQLAALTCAAAVIIGEQAASMIGRCVPMLRLRQNTCNAGVDLSYADFLLDQIVVQGALGALAVGVLVLLLQRAAALVPAALAGRPRVRSAVLAAATAALVAVGLAAGSTLSAMTDTPTAVADPAPTRSGAAVSRVLSQAEAQRVADAARPVLPRHWRTLPESTSSGTAVLDDPEHCTALVEETYLTVDDAQPIVARSRWTDGDKITTSSVNVTVRSYPHPVPPALFTAAEKARQACPRFTYTSGEGTPLHYTVSTGRPPALGDQAWRVDLAMTAEFSGMSFQGSLIIVLVRVEHTLVQVTFDAFSEPVDEELLRDVLDSTVGSVP